MYICDGLVLNLPPENKPWNVSKHMKTEILTILFFLQIIISYSQEKTFNEIKYDPKLQIIHKDTLKNVQERLNGKWKYLGKKINGKFSDTISVSYYEDRTVTTTIENGIVYESEKDIKKKLTITMN